MKIIIVGGVAGGAGAAARLRRNDEDAQIILLEKDAYISYANCGLPYYIGGVITEKEALLLQTPKSFYDRFRIDVRIQNEVTSVDTAKKTVTVLNKKDATTYTETYDKLILSPGAVPIVPPIKGVEQEHVFSLRNVPDTFKIREFIDCTRPESAVVVGGGFVGLEMADNLRRLGLAVAIVEAAEHVVASLDPDMAFDVHNHIRSKGVGLVLNDAVTSIEDGFVRLASGRELPADLVILGVGVRPNTGFLRGSGVELGARGGIVVDDMLRTSAPDVYALGDAAFVREFVLGGDALIALASPANKQARIVADNVLGGDRHYHGTQGTAIAKVFEMTVATTGANEKALGAAKKDYLKSFTYSASHAGYYPGGSFLFLKLLFEPVTGKLLGAQATGFEGVDKRIDVLAAAIREHLTVDDLTELELAYAPPYSSAKDPVNMAGYAAQNVLEGRVKNFYLEEIGGATDGILLDSRTRGEFQSGSIPGSVNIPLDEIRDRLGELDPKKKIYNFCQIGLRGYIGCRILMQHGYDVKNLSGGYRHYEAMKLDREGADTALPFLACAGK